MPRRPRMTTPCPLKCDHGFVHSCGDGWDEWDECRLCNNGDGYNDTGRTTKKRIAEFRKEEARQVAEAEEHVREWEAEMKQPCAKCGLPKIDHYSREDEPCKSIEQFNREYAEQKALRISNPLT